MAALAQLGGEGAGEGALARAGPAGHADGVGAARAGVELAQVLTPLGRAVLDTGEDAREGAALPRKEALDQVRHSE